MNGNDHDNVLNTDLQGGEDAINNSTGDKQPFETELGAMVDRETARVADALCITRQVEEDGISAADLQDRIDECGGGVYHQQRRTGTEDFGWSYNGTANMQLLPDTPQEDEGSMDPPTKATRRGTKNGKSGRRTSSTAQARAELGESVLIMDGGPDSDFDAMQANIRAQLGELNAGRTPLPEESAAAEFPVDEGAMMDVDMGMYEYGDGRPDFIRPESHTRENPVTGLPKAWDGCVSNDLVVINIPHNMMAHGAPKFGDFLTGSNPSGRAASMKRLIFLFFAAAFYSVAGLKNESRHGDEDRGHMARAQQRGQHGRRIQNNLRLRQPGEGQGVGRLNAREEAALHEHFANPDAHEAFLINMFGHPDDPEIPAPAPMVVDEAEAVAQAQHQRGTHAVQPHFVRAVQSAHPDSPAVDHPVPFISPYFEYLYDEHGRVVAYRLWMFFMMPDDADERRAGQEDEGVGEGCLPLAFDHAVDRLIGRNSAGYREHVRSSTRHPFAPIDRATCYREINSLHQYLSTLRHVLGAENPALRGAARASVMDTRGGGLAMQRNPIRPTTLFNIENAMTTNVSGVCMRQRDINNYVSHGAFSGFPLPAATFHMNYEHLEPNRLHGLPLPRSALMVAFENYMGHRLDTGRKPVVHLTPDVLNKLIVESDDQSSSALDAAQARHHVPTDPRLMTDRMLMEHASAIKYAAHVNGPEKERIAAAHPAGTAKYREEMTRWKEQRGEELLRTMVASADTSDIFSPAQQHAIRGLVKARDDKRGAQFFQLAQNLTPDSSALATLSARMAYFFRIREGNMQRHVMRTYFAALTGAHYWHSRIKCNLLAVDSAATGKSFAMAVVSALLCDGTWWSLTRVTRSAFLTSGNLDGMAIFLPEAYAEWFGIGTHGKEMQGGTEEFKNILTDQKAVTIMCRIDDDGNRIQVRSVVSMISVFIAAMNVPTAASPTGHIEDERAELTRFVVFPPDVRAPGCDSQTKSHQSLRDLVIESQSDQDMPAFREFQEEMHTIHSLYHVVTMFIGAKVMDEPNPQVMIDTMAYLNRKLEEDGFDKLPPRLMEQMNEFAIAMTIWNAIVTVFGSEYQFLEGTLGKTLEPILDNDGNVVGVKSVAEGVREVVTRESRIVHGEPIPVAKFGDTFGETEVARLKGQLGEETVAKEPRKVDHRTLLAVEPFLCVGVQQAVFTLTLFAGNIIPLAREIIRSSLSNMAEQQKPGCSFLKVRNPVTGAVDQLDMRYVAFDVGGVDALASKIARDRGVTAKQIRKELDAMKRIPIRTKYPAKIPINKDSTETHPQPTKPIVDEPTTPGEPQSSSEPTKPAGSQTQQAELDASSTEDDVVMAGTNPESTFDEELEALAQAMMENMKRKRKRMNQILPPEQMVRPVRLRLTSK